MNSQIVQDGAEVAVIDITGVPTVDPGAKLEMLLVGTLARIRSCSGVCDVALEIPITEIEGAP